MTRKYRQQGYQETDERPDRPRASRPRTSRDGPRSPKMPGLRQSIKCSNCGSLIPSSVEEITLSSVCPQCESDLHTCKNCVYFNPSARFECGQPVTRRISPKDKRARCKYFEIRTTVEKITSSSPKQQGTLDAREAFENLFKS